MTDSLSLQLRIHAGFAVNVRAAISPSHATNRLTPFCHPSHVAITSKYPSTFNPSLISYRKQIAELHSRGWNKRDLAGLTGGNLLRIMRGAEAVAREMKKEGVKPVMDVYAKREDL